MIAGKTTFFMFLCLFDPSSHLSRCLLSLEGTGIVFPAVPLSLPMWRRQSDGQKYVDIRVAFLFCFNCGYYLIAVVEALKSARDRNLRCKGCFDNYLVNPQFYK